LDAGSRKASLFYTPLSRDRLPSYISFPPTSDHRRASPRKMALTGSDMQSITVALQIFVIVVLPLFVTVVCFIAYVSVSIPL
jgi:hypothetical protein